MTTASQAAVDDVLKQLDGQNDPSAPGTKGHDQRMANLYNNQGNNGQPDGNVAIVPQRPADVPEKFWDAKTGTVNTAALLKSYSELEKAKGNNQNQPAPEAKTQQQNQQTAENAVAQAGLDLNTLTSKLVEKGAIDQDDYDKLAKVGFPKEFVDNYINGLKVGAQARVDRTAAYVAQQSGQDGAQYLEKMLVWAGANMSATQRTAINTLLASDDAWQEGINQLGMAYERANPMAAEGNPITGGHGAGGGGAFETIHEQTAAINDPRYKTSPAYRKMVEQRILASKF